MEPAALSADASAPGEPRVRHARVRIPVRAKITAPFLLIALAMAVLAGFVLYQVVFETLDQRFNTQLIESGKLAADWMVHEENTRLTNLRVLSHTGGVGDALQARNVEALRRATLGYIVGNQEDAVEFLDTEGNLVLSMRHRPGSLYLEDYVFSTGSSVNYRQWPFVERVLSQSVDALGDKHSGLARAPWGDFFYVAGPIRDQAGRFAGAILVGEAMSTLVHRMRLDIGSQFTVYDLDGKPIASTFTALGLSSPLAAKVLQDQSHGSFRRDSAGSHKLTYSALDYGELLGPWKARGSQDLGLLGTAIPRDFLMRTSTAVRIQLATLVGLAFFLVLILGGMVAHRITRPLTALVAASEAVAQGNLEVKVLSRSNDEIGDLANHFNHMTTSIQQSQRNLLKTYDNTLEGWAKAADLKDNETERHMRNVVDLTLRLASRMGYEGERLTSIYRGALLHDIGKIGVPDAILKKPGRLSDEERIEMQRHTQYAFDILSQIDFLGSALLIPYYHHERWDGTGYPIGLKGEDIPESARIFAVVDVWDAMTADRIYRAAMSHDDVAQHLRDARGTHFDPRVVDTFLDMIGRA